MALIFVSVMISILAGLLIGITVYAINVRHSERNRNLSYAQQLCNYEVVKTIINNKVIL